MDPLITDRLIIRAFTLDDLEAAYQLFDIDLEWSDEENRTREHRRAELQFDIRWAADGLSGEIFGKRAIILKESGALIGMCRFRPSLWTAADRAAFGDGFFGPADPYTSPELEIGYALGTAYRGKGYAREAAGALIDHAFRVLKVRRVIATAVRDNLDSRRVMERLGMRTAVNPNAEWPGIVGILDNNLASPT